LGSDDTLYYMRVTNATGEEEICMLNPQPKRAIGEYKLELS